MSITQILRVMKLTAILLTVCCIHLMAAAGAQTISYSGKNVTLKDIFKAVKKQTGYLVVYNANQISGAQFVTVDAKDQPLTQFLNNVLKGKGLDYTIENKTIVVSPQKKEASPISQELNPIPAPPTVHGRITNEKGEPVAGVSISIKGVKTVGVTNDNGEFTLSNIPDNATLVFSGVNIQTYETKLNGRMELAITARVKVVALEDVVIEVSNGYQALAKERVNGSFEQVNNKQINQRVTTSILDRLEGVSSLLFDRNTNRPALSLRGYSSINSSKDPLIILDNFPYEGNMNNLNPNDIESVTLLKDASATSIYGTRGGNGVIVITSKKGKYNQPLRLDVTSNLTMIQKPDVFYTQPMSTSDFIGAETFLFNNNYYTSQFTNTNRPLISPVVEILNRRKAGTITASDSASQIDALRGGDVRNDMDRYLYQSGFNQQYAMSMSGGNANSSYLLSGGYDHNTSTLAAGLQRANFKSVLSFRPIKGLQVSSTIQYTSNISRTGKPSINSLLLGGKQIYPYAQLADASGNSTALYNYRQIYSDTAGAGKLLDWKYYPLDDYKHATTTTNLQDMVANLQIAYAFNSSLSLNVLYQYERQQTQTDALRDAQSYFARDLINRFTQINFATGVVNNVIPKGGILDRTQQTLQSHNGRAQFGYAHTWGKHQVNAIGGAEIRETRNDGNSFRLYGYNDDRLFSASIDYVNSYPTYLTKSTSVIPGGPGVTGTLIHFVSEFFNGSYTYDGRYSVTVSGRRDASNLFGLKTNDKWTPLWSVATGWQISRESFYHLNALPDLKLRMSYGYNGNVDQSKSAVPTIRYINSPSQYTGYPYALPFQFTNPDLRWERVKMFNVGVDFGFKNKAVSGSLEYYDKKGTDLFGTSLADYTTLPTASILKNVADMRSNGLDLNLQIKLIEKSKFAWNTQAFFSWNHTRITNYYLSTVFASSFVNGGNVITPVVGQPLYSIISYRFAGLDPVNGDPLGYFNGAKSKVYSSLYNDSVQNLAFGGSATPTIYGSFNNSVSWKGWTLTASVAYRLGYYFRKSTISYSDLAANWRGNSDYALRWQKAGDELTTNVPSFTYPLNSQRDGFYSNSDILVRKADNIRLSYVNLSYQLNHNGPLSRYLRDAQVYLLCSDLGILWRANKDHLDPDYDPGLPPRASFTIGFKASIY